jgi:segregation and condensation protein A
MAAMLAEIKSRMLLPRPAEEEDEGEDPRAELIRRLQEYERYKQAAEDLHTLPQVGRDLYLTVVEVPDKHVQRVPPEVDLKELLLALKDVLHRADLFTSHHIAREPLSLRERMSRVLEAAKTDRFTPFTELFDIAEGRQGVVVTFMAVLELIKQSLIELVQAEPFAPIHVKARSS